MCKKINLAEEFYYIAKEVVGEDKFNATNFPNTAIDWTSKKGILCPDQFVGIICIESGLYTWEEEHLISVDRQNNNLKIGQKEDVPIIVIVLESPHKDEFSMPCRMANGPAFGKTGSNIKDYFCNILNRSKCINIKDNRYKILLVNSVQYQCSLSFKTKKYRNLVFSKCINKYFF